ncbi:MAG TPA: DMT family transporter [bacterium]|nr:DMT family transporter [bacterium]
MASPHPRITFMDFTIIVSLPVVWGLNYVIIKGALPSFSSPQTFNALRWTLGALILLGGALARRESLRIDPRDWGRVAVVAGVGIVLQQITFINGLPLTTAGHSALINGLSPSMVAVTAAVLGLERISRLTWSGVGLSVVGLALVSRPDAGTLPPTAAWGDLLTLGSAACWVAYTLVSRPLAERYPPWSLSAVTLGLATIVLVLIALPDLRAQSWQLGWGAWLALIYSGALTIALGYVLWTIALRRIGATQTAVLTNLNPVVALTAAWFLLGERLSLTQACGAACVVAGVALTRIGRARRV